MRLKLTYNKICPGTINERRKKGGSEARNFAAQDIVREVDAFVPEALFGAAGQSASV